MAEQQQQERAPQWRTVTRDGRTIRYAVLRRAGRRIVLIKRGK